ncbi:hypothetical protein GN325_13475 [Agrobacterium vitis]|uniref:hypothetical protein n=1 Tax=Agrobacterium vitis TaxID=373 RepID=UPI001113D164|nr:hypothetical protein [Agrobacterium vitis]MVB02813.1 hypothetical protein [Agrobacterium vitis]
MFALLLSGKSPTRLSQQGKRLQDMSPRGNEVAEEKNMQSTASLNVAVASQDVIGSSHASHFS